MQQKQQGFTIIELLVAVGIIGILSSIAVVSIGNVRAKSRDSKRLADAKQIQGALEAYFNDNNEYPYAGAAISLGVDDAGDADSDAEFGRLCDTDAGFQEAACAAGVTVFMNPVPGSAKPLASIPAGANAPYNVAEHMYQAWTDTVGSANTCEADEVCGVYRLIFRLESGAGTLTAGAYSATSDGIVRSSD